MPGENEDKELLNGAGNEAEADAGAEHGEDEIRADGEDAAEGDGSEAEGQEELAADEEGEKPPSRAQSRIQRLSHEASEARRESAELRQRLDRFESEQRQRTQPSETAEQKAQRFALMTPEERMEARLVESEQRNQQVLSQMAFQNQDAVDKGAFQSLCLQDPIAARYKDRVEQELTRLRAQGQNVSREALTDYLFGKDSRAKRGGAEQKQRKDGERKIARQTTKPGNSRGDEAPAKRGEKSLEDRLSNVTF